jgi:MFS transporter, ACS family, allantoate permease
VTFYGAYVQSVSLVSSNVAGHTKKTTVNAVVGTLAYVGAIVGPFVFKGEEAPRGYPTGMITVLIMLVVVFVCFVLLA